MNGIGDREASAPALRSSSDAGFTLIEFLVVLLVLGILAAIVIFTLTGTTNQGVKAACDGDAKTVGIAIAAYQTQHPMVTQVTEGQLVASGVGTLQSWPQSPQNRYDIVIAGDGNALAGTFDGAGALIRQNDVLVKVGSSYFDATLSAPAACAAA